MLSMGGVSKKGQDESQVQLLRGRLSVAKPAFDDLEALNDWLRLSREELANRPHPAQSDRTIAPRRKSTGRPGDSRPAFLCRVTRLRRLLFAY